MAGPLLGKTILITRQASRADSLRSSLSDAGARILVVPVIAIRPRTGFDLDSLRSSLRSSHWLILSSANAAEIFLGRLDFAQTIRELGGPGRPPQICAVGTATAETIRRFELSVDLIPDQSQSEGILDALRRKYPGGLSGIQFFLPRAARGREVLPQELRRRGGVVTCLDLYDTVPAEENRGELLRILKDETPDLITLTSPSTADFLKEMVGEHVDLNRFRYACIGPVTAEAAARLGMPIVVAAKRASAADLADSIRRYFQTTQG